MGDSCWFRRDRAVGVKHSGILVNSFTVEYVASGVINERSSDGLLTSFTVDNSNPKTIDAWLESAKSTILNWPPQQPCYSLHDIRKTGLHTFDADLWLRFRDLFGLRQDLEYSVAVVISVEFADAVGLLNGGGAGLDFPFEHQLFLTRNEALAWLIRERQ